jgi:hypothetical protein
MKLNKFLLAVSLSVGVLAGLWQVLVQLYPTIVSSFPLAGVGVAGFLGWATFYAAGGKKEGFLKGTAANLTGILWGVVIVVIWNLFNFNNLGAFIAVGIGAGMMCFQAHIKALSFIPGAFIGASTFFALGATITGAVLWPAAIGLVLGLAAGWLSETVAIFLNGKFEGSKK